MERGGGVKAFVATPAGKVALTAVAALVLVGSLVYVGALIAIAAFLLFMLAVPIYLGWKRPRELAVCGLAAVLVAGPIGAALYADQLRVPSPSVGSDPETGVGGTGSVLTNAQVSPFAADTGSAFVFSVTINPQYLPASAHAPEYLVLYLSTCANATNNNESACGGGGYPYWEQDLRFNASLQNASPEQFSQTLNSVNLWFWQLAFIYENGSTNQTNWVWLDPQSGYGAVQGPVSGDFLSTVSLVLPAFFSELFLYVALVFYAALLLYMYLRARAARRQGGDAGPPGPSAPSGGAPPGPGGPKAASSGGAAPGERSCPNCGAVIYPSETSCWKCGKPISPASSQPLS